MNEKRWYVSSEPIAKLKFIRDKTSPRKLRLFACACCRTIWPLLTDERSRRSVEVAELYADEKATSEDLTNACRAAWDVALDRGTWDARLQRESTLVGLTVLGVDLLTREIPTGLWTHLFGSSSNRAAKDAADAAAWCAFENVWEAASKCHESASLTGMGFLNNHVFERYSAILRCLFGNPFRPAIFSPTWRTWNDAIVVRLAQAAYDNRILPAGTLDNARLAVLADALEEAGCSDAQILGHLRGGGEHYRGCWVIDALLGKG